MSLCFLLRGWTGVPLPAGVSEQLLGLWVYALNALSHKPCSAEQNQGQQPWAGWGGARPHPAVFPGKVGSPVI